MTLELWHLYTLGGVISFVLFAQFFKLAVNNAKNDTAATLLAQGIGGLSALLFIPFFEIKFSDNWVHYALAFGAIIFYGLADRIQTTSRKHLEVSVVSIVSQIGTVFMLIYGVLLYQEPVVLNKVLGGILILVANIFVLFKGRTIRFDKYIGLALLGFFFLATAVSVDIGVSQNFNLPMYVAAALLIPMILIALSDPKSLKELSKEFNPNVRKYYVLSGFFWALAIILQFKAFQTGTIAAVAPLLATNVLLNVIFAYLFLNERSGLIKKLTAAVLVIIGIYLTAI